MRFRTRLLVRLIALAVLTNGLLLAITHDQATAEVKRRIESTVLSIASTAALRVDGDALRELVRRGAPDSPEYRAIQAELRAVRDANRRSDLHVRFVYTLHRDPADPGRYVFGVDAEEPGEDFSPLGKAYDPPPDFVFNGDAPYVFPEFESDEYGVWVTAQAPVRAADGTCVGVIGVDVAADDVVRASRHLLLLGSLAILTALLVGVLVASHIATRVSRPLAKIRDAAEAIGHGRLDTQVEVESDDEFGEVAAAMNDMTLGLVQRENLKGALARYVSEDVTQAVLDQGSPQIEGERRTITVLFADLRGFTSVSERTSPERVVAMLNEFYGRMIEAVVANKGLLNKFLGDGLMAVFGAPRDDRDHPEHAVAAGLQMVAAQRALRRRWVAEVSEIHAGELGLGVGIHTGDAIVGNVGSEQRMEYTAIGDTVNLASRLQSATKEVGVQLLMSAATADALAGRVATRALGEVRIRGKEAPVAVYTAEADDAGPRGADLHPDPRADR